MGVGRDDVHAEAWPTSAHLLAGAAASPAVSATVAVVVQVRRARLVNQRPRAAANLQGQGTAATGQRQGPRHSPAADKAALAGLVQATEMAQRALRGRVPERAIVARDRLVNFVVP